MLWGKEKEKNQNQAKTPKQIYYKMLSFESKITSSSGQSISQGKALSACSSFERDMCIWVGLNLWPQYTEIFFPSHGVKKLVICNWKHKMLCNLQKQKKPPPI